MKRAAPLLLALLAACNAPSSNQAEATPSPSPLPTPTPSVSSPAPVEPPVPGTSDGLPDDRTPVSEAPFSKTSAQGAAQVVQSYFALIEAGKYRDARALWSDGGKGSGKSAEAFAASFDPYAEYHAQIGAPGRIEGAAGSLYVEVPIVTYGRLKSGAAFNRKGSVTLRRCNDVPGCTAEQREWQINSVTS